MTHKLLKEFIKEFVLFEKDQGIKQYHEGDVINPNSLDKHFKLFHISNQNLGDTFIFTPRTPYYPYRDGENVIEDDFTNRISLAPTFEKAVEATSELRPFVYCTDLKRSKKDNVKTIDLEKRILDCPTSPGNKYGPDFRLLPWKNWIINQIKDEESESTIDQIKYALSPSSLPDDLKQDFFGCVPDAEATEEKWTLESVEMTLVAKQRTLGSALYMLTALGAELLNKSTK